MKPLLDNKAYKQYATSMEEHEKNKILQQQAFKQMLAFTYLAHADQTKYGSILNGLITQQSLCNNQYPKTTPLLKANNVLSNHGFNVAKFANKIPNKNQNDQAKCEPEPEKINLSFVQMESKCFCCSKMGHKSPQCRFKDIPKAEWAINKSQQSHAQAGKTEAKVSKSVQASKATQQPTLMKSEGWSGVHHQLYQQESMKEWIRLNNKSTVTIFCNLDMVQDI
jgi:hypothetical protein